MTNGPLQESWHGAQTCIHRCWILLDVEGGLPHTSAWPLHLVWFSGKPSICSISEARRALHSRVLLASAHQRLNRHSIQSLRSTAEETWTVLQDLARKG